MGKRGSRKTGFGSREVRKVEKKEGRNEGRKEGRKETSSQMLVECDLNEAIPFPFLFTYYIFLSKAS